MIIGLVGPKLSGKGTVATYIEEQKGARVYSMSGVIIDIGNRVYLPKTRANMISVATAMRQAFGEDIFARVRKHDIEKAHDSLAIIDGIRMPKEVDIFAALPNFYLLFIDSPLDMRYKRALERGEKEGEKDMTFEQFKAEENAVTEQNIEALRKKSEFVIMNNSSKEHLFSEIDRIFDVLS